MDKSENPEPLETALPRTLKLLRESLGESQQVFATRLGISIRALANYEKDRRPRGKVLIKLLELASEVGRDEWLTIFRRAARVEFESDTFTVLDKAGSARDILVRLHESVTELYRPNLSKKEFSEIRKRISASLREFAEELDMELENLEEK